MDKDKLPKRAIIALICWGVIAITVIILIEVGKVVG